MGDFTSLHLHPEHDRKIPSKIKRNQLLISNSLKVAMLLIGFLDKNLTGMQLHNCFAI